MDIKDSSDDEDDRTRDITFGKFDEAIVVRNAEEIKSPVSRGLASSRRTRKSITRDSMNTLASNSPRGGRQEFRR